MLPRRNEDQRDAQAADDDDDDSRSRTATATPRWKLSLAFLFLIVAGVFLAFSHDSWSNSLWYSVQYHVDLGNVETEAKPDDCDFSRAPLGSKGCSYKAHVQVFNADGTLVAGYGAPRYGKD